MNLKNTLLNQFLHGKSQVGKLDLQDSEYSAFSTVLYPIFKQKHKKHLIYKEKIESLAILPAFNLEDNIEDIVKRTKNYVDEVIVISDGSNDNTYLKAKCAGAICPPHSNIMGKGYAIRKGIEYSKMFKPKYIVFMDSDGQHLPEEIPKFLYPLRNEKKDMVIGSRFKGLLKTSLTNRFGNYFLNILSFVLTGKWFSDIESGFRAFLAEKLYYLDLNTNNYEIECEILLKSIYKRFKIIEVPITIPKAIPGITIIDGVKIALYAVKAGFLMNLRRFKIQE